GVAADVAKARADRGHRAEVARELHYHGGGPRFLDPPKLRERSITGPVVDEYELEVESAARERSFHFAQSLEQTRQRALVEVDGDDDGQQAPLGMLALHAAHRDVP